MAAKLGYEAIKFILTKEFMRKSGTRGITTIPGKAHDMRMKQLVDAMAKKMRDLGYDVNKVTEKNVQGLLDSSRAMEKQKKLKVISQGDPEFQGITDKLLGKKAKVHPFQGFTARVQQDVDGIIKTLKSMEPMDAMKEANLIIGRKGNYKHLSGDEAQRILKETDDHIFQRDIKPDPEDMASGGVAGQLHLNEGGRVPMIFGGSAGLKGLIASIKAALNKGRKDKIKTLFPKYSVEEKELLRLGKKYLPKDAATLAAQEAAGKAEGIQVLINRLKHDKKILERQAKNKAMKDPNLDFLTKHMEESMPDVYGPHLKKYTDIDKDILQLEMIKKNLMMKGRKLNAEGGIAGQLHLNEGGRARFANGTRENYSQYKARMLKALRKSHAGQKTASTDLQPDGSYSGVSREIPIEDYFQYMLADKQAAGFHPETGEPLSDIEIRTGKLNPVSTNVPGTPIVPTTQASTPVAEDKSLLSKVVEGAKGVGQDLLTLGSIPANYAAGLTGLPIGYTTQAMRDRVEELAKSKGTGEFTVGYDDLGMKSTIDPTSFGGIIPESGIPPSITDLAIGLTAGDVSGKVSPEGKVTYDPASLAYDFGQKDPMAKTETGVGLLDVINRGGLTGRRVYTPMTSTFGSQTTQLTPEMQAAADKGMDPRMGRTYQENIQAMADPRMRGAKGGLARILGV